MGCPSEVYIGRNLTFSVTTHDPVLDGAQADADAPPTYRIYEDETATPILTGTMAKLDDANTLGFYTELIACTTENGFEPHKSYTVYISATVNGTTGGTSYTFRALTDPYELDFGVLQLASLRLTAPGIQRNVALSNFQFPMLDATDHVTGKTGLTVVARRKIDAEEFLPCANSPVEVSNGFYAIDFAATDLNGRIITFVFSAPGADDTSITIVTRG